MSTKKKIMLIFVVLAVLLFVLVAVAFLLSSSSSSSSNSNVSTIVITTPSSQGDGETTPPAEWDPAHNPDPHIQQARLDYSDFSAQDASGSSATDFRVHFFRPAPERPYGEVPAQLARLDLEAFPGWVQSMMRTKGVHPLPEDDAGGVGKFDIYLLHQDERADEGYAEGNDDDKGYAFVEGLYGYSQRINSGISGETFVVLNIGEQEYQEGTGALERPMPAGTKADLVVTTFHEIYHSVHVNRLRQDPRSPIVMEGLATAAEFLFTQKLTMETEPGLTPEVLSHLLSNGGRTFQQFGGPALDLLLLDRALPNAGPAIPLPDDVLVSPLPGGDPLPLFCLREYSAFLFIVLTLVLGVHLPSVTDASGNPVPLTDPKQLMDILAERVAGLIEATDIWDVVRRAYASRAVAPLPSSALLLSQDYEFVHQSMQPTQSFPKTLQFALHNVTCYLTCLHFHLDETVFPIQNRPSRAVLPPMFQVWADAFFVRMTEAAALDEGTEVRETKVFSPIPGADLDGFLFDYDPGTEEYSLKLNTFPPGALLTLFTSQSAELVKRRASGIQILPMDPAKETELGGSLLIGTRTDADQAVPWPMYLGS